MYPSCDTIYTGVMLNVEITRTIFLFVVYVSPVPSLVVVVTIIVSFRTRTSRITPAGSSFVRRLLARAHIHTYTRNIYPHRYTYDYQSESPTTHVCTHLQNYIILYTNEKGVDICM